MTESSHQSDFQEIANCGGQATIKVATHLDGKRSVQFGVRHSRPNAAAWFAIYALPQGIPAGMIEVGGIGRAWNPPPHPSCIPVFISSDSEGRFGHRCPHCRGYWRSAAVPARWGMTCPYCGLGANTHEFLTLGQRQYVQAYCHLASVATDSPDGEYVLDMDDVAGASGRDLPKPKYYYTEESQQNRFHCVACGAFNDILGRYGYCSNCGTFNALAELDKDVSRIRERIASGRDLESSVRDSVASFDSFARQIAKQLAHRVPMTQQRRNEWKRRLFHRLSDAVSDLQDVFDIDLVQGMTSDDVAFATLMFHRRHLYEHNGGEVDERYINDSGDRSLRSKQLLRESPQSAARIVKVVLQLGTNLSRGFHRIFAAQEAPIRIARRLPK